MSPMHMLKSSHGEHQGYDSHNSTTLLSESHCVWKGDLCQ